MGSPRYGNPQTITWKQTLLLSYQSFGVVYGHLSIGPLYVFNSIAPDTETSEERLYELLSFIFWTMTLIPFVKYMLMVLMADDNGEGGTFALYSLLCRHYKVGLLPNKQLADDELLAYEKGIYNNTEEPKPRRAIEKNRKGHYVLLMMALFAACLIIVNGILVPAISASRRREEIVKYMSVPTACTMLICLFILQHYGTHKIGFLFAPIIIIWLLFISGIGLHNILKWNVHVIDALSPAYLYRFLMNIDVRRWQSLGGVLLCIAGSEAMFSNLGHFSKKSIKIAFCLLVYPSLILCYMGQAAYISRNLNPVGVSYYSSWIIATCPGSLRHIFAWLSLLVSAVGSQATITGTFSIINQCLALGCFPRVKVVHTSDKIHGQVYIPDINWILMVLCLLFTMVFKDIACFSNAAGLAIITGMLITTSFMSLVIALYWGNVLAAAMFLIVFGSIESMYILACLLNFQKSAWFFLIYVGLILTVMISWHYGYIKTYEFDVHNKVSTEWLASLGPGLGIVRVPGIAFVNTDSMTGIPPFFSHFITNLPAFHQVLIFIAFKPVPLPYVQLSKQYLIGRLGPRECRVYRCIVRYGYCDRLRDIDEFEEHIIRGIGEFVSLDVDSTETSASPQNTMIVTGSSEPNAASLIRQASDHQTVGPGHLLDLESRGKTEKLQVRQSSTRRRKVRFLLPPEGPRMNSSVRGELQELVDARDHGITYLLSQPHFYIRRGSNLLKRAVIKVYIFLAKNSRESSVTLDIPQSAYLEVGMSYTI